MRYALDELSVAPIQSLYACRLLKHPASFLNPVYRSDVSDVLSIGLAEPTDEVDVYGRIIYRFSARVSDKHHGKIPMLEFEGPDTALSLLSDIISVELDDELAFLVGGRHTWDPELKIRCYWCPSFQDIEEALLEFQKQLADLKNSLSGLITAVASSGPVTASLDDSIPGNLVKTAESNILSSTYYRIQEQTAKTVTLATATQRAVDRLPKQVVGQLYITQTTTELSLSQFTGGEIVISGSGNLYLYNVSSKVTLDNFTGNLYALQCSSLYIIRGAYIQRASLVHSAIEMYAGSINDLYLARKSSFHHAGGRVANISHIGVACNYTSAIPAAEASMNEPKTIDRREVQGLYTSYTGEVIKNGKDIAFQRGTVESALPSTELVCLREVDVIPPTGEGVEPTPPVPDGVAIPTQFYNLNNEIYRTTEFSQSFMMTSSGPQTMADVTSETFHPLRALMNWCVGEFGPSIYGVSFGKLIRTSILWVNDSYYRGAGKTLKDYVMRLRSQVISWGGRDIWNTSYQQIKDLSWMTDEYAFNFMRNLYDNIRYPNLYGVSVSSDIDVIKAMSGMPLMNETVAVGNPTIPDRNKPLAWVVSKQAVMNEFSGYVAWYVIYRPTSFDYQIGLGPNPAVL